MAELLPPLNALRAFEATARHLSFSRAADELHVTPAALSHQIKGLEDFLGVKLFNRKPRAIELTEAGRMLYPGTHAAFAQLRQAVHSLERIRNDRVLVVSAPPGFTAKWLAPRLHRFLTANPDIDARISSTQVLVEFEASDVDVTIRNSAQRSFPDLHAEKLVDIVALAVASPRLIEELGGLREPSDLLRTTLIVDDSTQSLVGAPNWETWFAAAGLPNADIVRTLHFNSSDHALEAAVEGAGVLFCARTLAYDDLRVGRLISPFDILIPSERAFWLLCPAGTETRPKVMAFRDWVRAEFDRMLLDCETVCRPPWKRDIAPGARPSGATIVGLPGSGFTAPPAAAQAADHSAPARSSRKARARSG
ncbi:MAG: transcriptional regulator GcvA [Hyphomicrobiaceae bacterium]